MALPSAPLPRVLLRPLDSATTRAILDGDRRPDLVTANIGSNDLRVLLGNGDGTFRGATKAPAGNRPESVAIADLDGDGRVDLFVANDVQNNNLWRNKGDGTFEDVAESPPPPQPNAVRAATETRRAPRMGAA